MKNSAARRFNMFPYIPHTPDDEKAMLKSIGVDSIEDLLSDIPDNLCLKRKLNIGEAMSEMEVSNHIKSIAKKNISVDDMACFLGAGAYDHYIPSVIGHIISRSEFYTAYTPYQPEISQGTLQSIFEYQTMISDLTGMDMANASMYDGATSTAEAAMVAVGYTKRRKVIVSRAVHPEVRKVLRTYMKFHEVQLIETDYIDGSTDTGKIEAVMDNTVAAVIIQNPNFFGIIEDAGDIERIVHSHKALLILNVNPISLGILKTPGEFGADIAVGEGQPLGNHLNFGGPYLGFMASTYRLMRKIPGRIVGQTEDVDGKRAFVLTLQTREQHIRREKATSNICSNEALNALSAAVYLTVMGKTGIREVALACAKKAHFAFNELTSSGKYKAVFNKPFFNEFALKSSIDAEKLNRELLERGILGGYDLMNDYPELNNCLLLCVTEKRTRYEIENLKTQMEAIE